MSAVPLSVFEAGDLPEYPIQSDFRLNNWFLRWESGRWLNSRTYLDADPEVGYAYLNLIFISQEQFPIGTLPADRRHLAKLLHVPVDVFEALTRRDPSPLMHWEPCVTDRGEVRLMHPVVRDMLLDQIADREKREERISADAERKRFDRLRQAMLASGFDKAVVSDDVLLRRLDQWLNENEKGNRTKRAYDRAFMFAARQKWFASHAVGR